MLKMVFLMLLVNSFLINFLAWLLEVQLFPKSHSFFLQDIRMMMTNLRPKKFFSRLFKDTQQSQADFAVAKGKAVARLGLGPDHTGSPTHFLVQFAQSHHTVARLDKHHAHILTCTYYCQWHSSSHMLIYPLYCTSAISSATKITCHPPKAIAIQSHHHCRTTKLSP